MDTALKWPSFLLLLLLLAACQGKSNLPARSTAANKPTASPVDSSWYSVYFTDPTNRQWRDTKRGGPDARLAQAIDAAQVSVDMAVLELDLWSIRDALLDAQQRGVVVRLVIESQYLKGREVQTLVKAGIPVVDDQSEGLMHSKFTVIDRQEVWSGSMNYTLTDGYWNNNNLIRIRSADLAADYTAEFEEMFSDHQFGPGSPANTPNPSLSVQGTRIEVCFAPDDGCAKKLIGALQQASQSIDFLAFSFTSDELAAAIFSRAKAGVAVRGVMEAEQVASNSGTEFANFQRAKLLVRKDGNSNYMHDKVMIIDQQIVVTGSYNFTYYGETRNDENLLVIYNPAIAGLYLQEFQRLYELAK